MLRRQVVLLIAVTVLFVRPASSQTTGGWEVEFFAGGVFASHPAGGTGTLPNPAEPYATISGQPSRKVSSWYFGDGSQLLNSVLQSFGRSERITALDPVLNKAALGRPNGGSLGFRVRRHLSPRLAAEFSLQSGMGRLGLSEDALKAIDATRNSFIVAWTALFATGAFGPPTITSVPTMSTGGRQLLTTGAVNFSLKSTGRLRPYVTGGAGVASRLGELPEVQFLGEYRALLFTSPISEHDLIRLHYTMPKSTFIGVMGGGVTYALSRSTGLRGDVRFHLGSHTAEAFVDTSPTVDPSTTNVFLIITTPTTPTILFRNLPNEPIPPTPLTQATFGPPALTDFRTFQGRGLQTQMSMTAGFFWRF